MAGLGTQIGLDRLAWLRYIAVLVLDSSRLDTTASERAIQSNVRNHADVGLYENGENGRHGCRRRPLASSQERISLSLPRVKSLLCDSNYLAVGKISESKLARRAA